MKRTQWHVTCTHNVHKKSGTSASFKKFNVSSSPVLPSRCDAGRFYICKRDGGGASGVGLTRRERECKKKERKKKKEEREIKREREKREDVKGRRKLIAIYSMNHHIDKARTFKGRAKKRTQKPALRQKRIAFRRCISDIRTHYFSRT